MITTIFLSLVMIGWVSSGLLRVGYESVSLHGPWVEDNWYLWMLSLSNSSWRLMSVLLSITRLLSRRASSGFCIVLSYNQDQDHLCRWKSREICCLSKKISLVPNTLGRPNRVDSCRKPYAPHVRKPASCRFALSQFCRNSSREAGLLSPSTFRNSGSWVTSLSSPSNCW